MALGLVVLVAVVFLNLPAQTAARLKLALGSLFLPLFGLAGSSQQALSKGVDLLTPRRELIRQNDQLRRENQELRLRAGQAVEVLRENTRLREQLKWQQLQKQWNLRLARVVLREPANWWRSVHIDLGTLHGVSNNLPVVTVDGLVGRIASASLTRSQVVLLGDSKCRVDARVDNDRRDSGILGTASSLDSNLVELNFMQRTADIKPGQAVFTSGLGGVFPKGIPIGRIVDVRPVEYGLYDQARVKLAANLSGLEEVWVLFP